MNNFSKLLSLLALFIITADYAAAAPQILSVETIAQPSPSIVLHGTGFQQGPYVMVFDNFEKGADNQVVPLSSPEVGSWTYYPSDGIPRYVKESDGNTAMNMRDFSYPLSSLNSDAHVTKVFDGFYRQALVAFSIRVPIGTTFPGSAATETFPAVSSWKMSWLMSGENGFGTPSLFDICLPTHVGHGSFVVGGNSGLLAWIASGDQWWSWTSYNNVVTFVGMDEKNPSTTPIHWYFHSVSDHNVTEEQGQTDASAYAGTDYQFDRINFPGWWGNGDNTNFNALMDNIYVAVGPNSLARVEVTDSADYTKSTTSIVLPTLSWEDAKITLDSSLVSQVGEASSGNTVYVYVFDLNGTSNSTGFPVTISGNAPPSAPVLTVY